MDFMSFHYYTLCAGVGHAHGRHNAFDRALTAGGISNYNLITISSILPPNCVYAKQVSLDKGSLLPTAIAANFSSSVGERISAAVAIAIPQNKNEIGVIMEHSTNLTKQDTEEQVREYAMQAMSDRNIKVEHIISTASECFVELPEYYCAFASVSLW